MPVDKGKDRQVPLGTSRVIPGPVAATAPNVPPAAPTPTPPLIASGNGGLNLAILWVLSKPEAIVKQLRIMGDKPADYGVPRQFIGGPVPVNPQVASSPGDAAAAASVHTTRTPIASQPAPPTGTPTSSQPAPSSDAPVASTSKLPKLPKKFKAPPVVNPLPDRDFNTDMKSSFEQVICSILYQCHADQQGVFRLFNPPQDDRYFVYLGWGDSYVLSQTLYDSIGWVLSVTAIPKITTPNPDMERSFYLPLLALYARWVEILTFSVSALKPVIGANPKLDIVKAASMVSVTWFKDRRGLPMVILGSSPGVFRFREYHVVSERQEQLLYRKYIPRDPAALTLAVPDGSEGEYPSKTAFGVCAETFSYLYARKLLDYEQPKERVDMLIPAKVKSHIQENVMTDIRGLALEPGTLRSDSQYKERLVTKILADPCLDCQDLIHQIGFNWHLTHDVEALRERITGVPRPIVGGAGGAGGAATIAPTPNTLPPAPATASLGATPSPGLMHHFTTVATTAFSGGAVVGSVVPAAITHVLTGGQGVS